MPEKTLKQLREEVETTKTGSGTFKPSTRESLEERHKLKAMADDMMTLKVKERLQPQPKSHQEILLEAVQREALMNEDFRERVLTDLQSGLFAQDDTELIS